MNTFKVIELLKFAHLDNEFKDFIKERCGSETAMFFEYALPALYKAVSVFARMGIDLENPVISDQQNEEFIQRMGEDLIALESLDPYMETLEELSRKIKQENEERKTFMLKRIEGLLQNAADEHREDLLSLKKALESV